MQMFPGMTMPGNGILKKLTATPEPTTGPAPTPAPGDGSPTGGTSAQGASNTTGTANSGAGTTQAPAPRAKRRKKDAVLDGQNELNTYATETTGV